jgi:beta-lactamase class A
MRLLSSRLLCVIFSSISWAFATAHSQSFENIQTQHHGQLGVYAIDTGTHQAVGINPDQRFPFDSTWKFMLVSAILKRSESAQLSLSQTIHYTSQDLTTDWNPVTSRHVKTGMTVSALCQAALQESDNSAANFLLKLLGGPEALNAFAKSIGDAKFTIQHDEPLVNAAIPGHREDTTTPHAMARSLQAVLLDQALAPLQRTQIQTWMKGNQTSPTQIRGGVPKNWIVADKTGSGYYGVTNDIGVIWPPHCSPLVIAIYFRTSDSHAMGPYPVIMKDATQTAVSMLAKTDPCLEQDLTNASHSYKDRAF